MRGFFRRCFPPPLLTAGAGDGANDDDDGRGRDGLLRSIEGSFRTIDRLKVESGLFD